MPPAPPGGKLGAPPPAGIEVPPAGRYRRRRGPAPSGHLNDTGNGRSGGSGYAFELAETDTRRSTGWRHFSPSEHGFEIPKWSQNRSTGGVGCR